jgi:hypothetical protein
MLGVQTSIHNVSSLVSSLPSTWCWVESKLVADSLVIVCGAGVTWPSDALCSSCPAGSFSSFTGLGGGVEARCWCKCWSEPVNPIHNLKKTGKFCIYYKRNFRDGGTKVEIVPPSHHPCTPLPECLPVRPHAHNHTRMPSSTLSSTCARPLPPCSTTFDRWSIAARCRPQSATLLIPPPRPSFQPQRGSGRR